MKAHIPSHPPHSTLKKKSSLLLSKPEMKVVSMKGWIIGTLRGWDILLFTWNLPSSPLVFKEGSVKKKKKEEDASLKTSVPPRYQAQMKKH